MPKDNKSELFYLVDKSDVVLGSVTREIAHSDRSKIHRAVDIWVRNGNKVLLQKRSLEKDTFPGYWTISAGGHVSLGESYLEAAKRELKEELGIEPNLKLLGKKLFDTGIEQEYSTVFEAEYDRDDFNLDATEVIDVRWVEINKLSEFIEKNDVTPSAKKSLVFAEYIDKM
jgi:isopentenyl-diphosphate delta-isomerase type 1